MSRTAEGLSNALDNVLAELRDEFWHNVNVLGSQGTFNQVLERAGRVADFLELAELMCLDALHRNESCGSHFREEYQTADGEARRDDEHYAYVRRGSTKGRTSRALTKSHWNSLRWSWRREATIAIALRKANQRSRFRQESLAHQTGSEER